jgi:hypothetical protein
LFLSKTELVLCLYNKRCQQARNIPETLENFPWNLFYVLEEILCGTNHYSKDALETQSPKKKKNCHPLTDPPLLSSVQDFRAPAHFNAATRRTPPHPFVRTQVNNLATTQSLWHPSLHPSLSRSRSPFSPFVRTQLSPKRIENRAAPPAPYFCTTHPPTQQAGSTNFR